MSRLRVIDYGDGRGVTGFIVESFRGKMGVSFPQVLLKTMWETWVKVCLKVSTFLQGDSNCDVIEWKSWRGGKVIHDFYYGFYTEKMGFCSLLGGKFCTFST